jgi:hypothetical protein
LLFWNLNYKVCVEIIKIRDNAKKHFYNKNLEENAGDEGEFVNLQTIL